MTNLAPHSSIILSGLILNVFLGWPESERLSEQAITLDIHIRFSDAPKGCITDKLEDTDCYDTLVRIVKDKIQLQQFKLLEHLGHVLYQTIKSAVSNPAHITIRVTKRPDISNLTGGVTFCYGDDNLTW